MRYGIQWKTVAMRTWRNLSVTKLAPFSRVEIEQYRHQVANDRQVAWHSVQLRGTVDGVPQETNL